MRAHMRRCPPLTEHGRASTISGCGELIGEDLDVKALVADAGVVVVQRDDYECERDEEDVDDLCGRDVQEERLRQPYGQATDHRGYDRETDVDEDESDRDPQRTREE